MKHRETAEFSSPFREKLSGTSDAQHLLLRYQVLQRSSFFPGKKRHFCILPCTTHIQRPAWMWKMNLWILFWNCGISFRVSQTQVHWSWGPSLFSSYLSLPSSSWSCSPASTAAVAESPNTRAREFNLCRWPENEAETLLQQQIKPFSLSSICQMNTHMMKYLWSKLQLRKWFYSVNDFFEGIKQSGHETWRTEGEMGSQCHDVFSTGFRIIASASNEPCHWNPYEWAKRHNSSRFLTKQNNETLAVFHGWEDIAKSCFVLQCNRLFYYRCKYPESCQTFIRRVKNIIPVCVNVVDLKLHVFDRNQSFL